MIYIDFPAASHGQFLEYLIHKHILHVQDYQNFLPFTDLGTSHKKPKSFYTSPQVRALHITEWNLGVDITADDKIIRIPVTSNNIYMRFIFWGNKTLRVGDGTFEIDDFEKNTLEKLKHDKYTLLREMIISDQGIKNRYSKVYLRNIFYSQIRENTIYFNKFRNFTCPYFVFDFENFYSFDNFLNTVNSLAMFLHKDDVNKELLFLDYQLFLQNNHVYSMKNRVEEFFNAMLEDKDIDLSLNIIEEAFLNVLITDKFNIHSDISIFEENNSGNSWQIANEIKTVLKNRNINYSLDLAINKQLNQIVYDF